MGALRGAGWVDLERSQGVGIILEKFRGALWVEVILGARGARNRLKGAGDKRQECLAAEPKARGEGVAGDSG